MREIERIGRILGLIKEIWSKYPDLRYMQLQDHLAYMYSESNEDVGKQYFYIKHKTDKGIQFTKTLTGVDLFYLEDDKFEEFLEGYINELELDSTYQQEYKESVVEEELSGQVVFRRKANYGEPF